MGDMTWSARARCRCVTCSASTNAAHKRRFSVKAGPHLPLAGERARAGVRELVKTDMEYIDNWSLGST